MQQIRPLMLSVAQRFSPQEADIAFRSFICWTVRFLISGGMRGGQLEDAYGSKAHEVDKGNIKTTKELLEALPVIPTDLEFQTAFSTARVSQTNLARYFLRAMEAHLRKETKQPELMPVRDVDILNLEHILPQEPADKWQHIDSETFDAYAKRIGNLTLLRTKTNSDFGNSSFQSKRAEFKKSPLKITSNIYEVTNDQTTWGPNEINERQKKLSELAVKTWPLSPK